MAKAQLMAPSPDPGLVLCVAGGIVRIAVGVRSAGIDRLIVVTAGECESRDREDDGEPHGHFQLVGAGQWDVRLLDAQEKSAIGSPSSRGVFVVGKIDPDTIWPE